MEKRFPEHSPNLHSQGKAIRHARIPVLSCVSFALCMIAACGRLGFDASSDSVQSVNGGGRDDSADVGSSDEESDGGGNDGGTSGSVNDGGSDDGGNDSGGDATAPSGLRIASHAPGALVTTFEETFSGTCVDGSVVTATPGPGVSIVGIDCAGGALSVTAGMTATRGSVEPRRFTLEDGTTTLDVLFGFRRDCPTGFVGVPNDATYATGDFCVAKYEMKATDGAGNLIAGGNGDLAYDNTYVPESRCDGTPWQNVTRQEASDECDSLGADYRLIDNDQWQAVARNVERTPTNWHATALSGGADGEVGNGMIPRGHSDGTPNASLAAAPEDSDAYAGTGNLPTEPWGTSRNSSGAEQARTLMLSNGSVIWDFAGNNWEWVSTQIGGDTLTPPFDTQEWRDFTDLAGFALGSPNRRLFGPADLYDQTNGMGRLFGGTNDDVARGSAGSGGTETSGVFSVGLNGATGRNKAFRCVFVGS